MCLLQLVLPVARLLTLSANFRRKGPSPTNHCRCQKTRLIALLHGIKISAVHCLVLSQSTRVTDGRTDEQTDRITTLKTALTSLRRAVKLLGKKIIMTAGEGHHNVKTSRVVYVFVVNSTPTVQLELLLCGH